MPPGRRGRRGAPRRGVVQPGRHPLSGIVVPFPVPADRAFDYLADPRHRPQWQSSLRAVADVVPVDGDARCAGTTWTDITVVPGIRPRMRTTGSEPGRRWAEDGVFRGFRATLALTFRETDAGCDVVADFAVRGLGVGRLVTWASRRPVAADLRRAATILGR